MRENSKKVETKHLSFPQWSIMAGETMLAQNSAGFPWSKGTFPDSSWPGWSLIFFRKS